MCLLIESQCSEETNRERREGGKGGKERREGRRGSAHKQCLLKAAHRLISINSSDFRKLIFCHWTVLYYLWLKWKPGSAAAMEERCIANDVAYASLHNQHLGKQRIKHSTGRERKTRAKCYIHTLAYWRRPGEHAQTFFICKSFWAWKWRHAVEIQPPVQTCVTLILRSRVKISTPPLESFLVLIKDTIC